MYKHQTGLAIVLKDECDRDNFTALEDLWKPADSKPFYNAVMGLYHFKFLLRCLQFDELAYKPRKKSS